MSAPVLIDQSGGLLTVTLNRPNKFNAMTAEMVDQMASAFENAANDETIKLVLIKATGKNFCTGADMQGLGSAAQLKPVERSTYFRDIIRRDSLRLFMAMHHLPQPVIMACRGHVIGAGVGMAAVADIVIASDAAKFCIPQIALGHVTDHGESWFLPRKIGLAKATQLCLMGERIGAGEAERIGLANWAVNDADLESRCDATITQLLSGPPVAIRQMKALLRQSECNSVEQQFEAEIATMGEIVATEDFSEAMASFAEKRPAKFAGK